MWSLSDFQLEVNATSTLLKARPGEPQLLEGLGASLKHKLEHMSLSTADVVACYDLVKACDLPQCLQTSLQSVLDTKALGSAQSALTVTTQAQQFDSIPAYLTQSEITKLENCNPFEGACVLASRCKLVGVKSLKESTKKVMTALLICFDMQRGGRRPEGDFFYRLSQHVRTTFANSATPNPPECLPLKVYPADPAGLSPKHFQSAYPEEKPVGCQFVGLAGDCHEGQSRAKHRFFSQRHPFCWHEDGSCKCGTPGRSSAAADWKPQGFAGKFHQQKQFDTCWDFGYSLAHASAEPSLFQAGKC